MNRGYHKLVVDKADADEVVDRITARLHAAGETLVRTTIPDRTKKDVTIMVGSRNLEIADIKTHAEVAVAEFTAEKSKNP